jgi:general secretion pathway protein G
MKVLQRRFMTLIEIMIVMFLIALITGVIAYNYRGSLDEGKAFKTKVAIEKLETILNLKISENPDMANNITSDWQSVVRSSPLVANPDALIRDGWGIPFDVSIDDRGGVHVSSQKYDSYVNTHQTMFGKERQNY